MVFPESEIHSEDKLIRFKSRPALNDERVQYMTLVQSTDFQDTPGSLQSRQGLMEA